MVKATAGSQRTPLTSLAGADAGAGQAARPHMRSVRQRSVNVGNVMTKEPSFPGRGILDRVERMAGVPLAAVTNSPQFSVALVLIQRADRAVRRPIGSLTARGLHLMNAPSYDDIRGLKRELAEVHRDLASLRRDLRAEDGPEQ